MRRTLQNSHMAPSPDPRWKASCQCFLSSTEDHKQGTVSFCVFSKQAEHDIPRTCHNEAVASQEAEVSAGDRCMPTGPASFQLTINPLFHLDLYGSISSDFSLGIPPDPFL